MKVAILAGGLGSRLGEETTVRPKPMVEIGGKPILWHIMKIYSHYGFNEFVVMCGYKGEYIKEYFLNYRANSSDITIDLSDNSVQVHKNRSEPWKITLCDTGKETLTGGRIAKIKKYIGNETFMLTYGDGVADINIPELLECHRNSGKIATLTDTIWEREPLNNLAEAGQLNAYLHCGFWRPMDMLKDKKDLNDLWSAGRAPWKIWD